MRQERVPGSGRQVGVIGQGSWGLGIRRERRAAEVAALRLGVSLGANLVDTAEYYGAGRTEELVGEAIAPVRDQVFLVTKVWPSHAAPEQVRASVRASLGRLGCRTVDAVLLHWPTRAVPLAATCRAFAELRAEGLIGAWGLSNFQGGWLTAAAAAASPGAAPAFNEVPYSLANRRVEHAVLSHARGHGQVLLAWSPLGHGGIARWRGYPVLAELAARRGLSPHQLALAFLVGQPGVVAIPRAASPDHARANAAAGTLALEADERARLEAAFPRGRRTRFPVVPPYDPVFRLLLWLERRQHGGGRSRLTPGR